MERKDPRDKPGCRQPTNAGPTDRLPFSFGVAVSDRRQLASAPSGSDIYGMIQRRDIARSWPTFCGKQRGRWIEKTLIATSLRA